MHDAATRLLSVAAMAIMILGSVATVPGGQSQVTPGGITEDTADLLQQVAVAGTSTLAPSAGQPNTLFVQLRARDAVHAGPAFVELTTPDEIQLANPSSPVLLSHLSEATLGFPFTPLEFGTLLLNLKVRTAGGELLADRDWVLDIPPVGPGNTYPDHLPAPEWAVPAIQLSPISPSPGIIDPDAEGAISPEDPMLHAPAGEYEDIDTAPEWGAATGGAGDTGISSIPSSVQVRACAKYKLDQNDDLDGEAPAQRGLTIFIKEDNPGGGLLDPILAILQSGQDGCFTSGSIDSYESLWNQREIYIQAVYCNLRSCANHGLVPSIPAFSYSTGFKRPSSAVGGILDFGLIAGGSASYGPAITFQYLNDAQRVAQNNNIAGGTAWALLGCRDCAEGGFYIFGVDTKFVLSYAAAKDPFSAPHELAHGKMHLLQAYNWNLPLATAYQNHRWCSTEQTELAFTEGFAHFFSAWVVNNAPAPGSKGLPRGYDIAGPSHPPKYKTYNIEAGSTCNNEGPGQDHEGHVAASLWDLTDPAGAEEGEKLDLGSSNALAKVTDAIALCTMTLSIPAAASYEEYGLCWDAFSGSECEFVKTAFARALDPRIDFNTPASATATQPSSFSWQRGYTQVAGTGSDPEGCSTKLDLYLSTDVSCDLSDTPVETGGDGYKYWDTRNVADAPSAYTCARAHDGMEVGGFSRGPRFGIDNTKPVTSASYTCDVPGNDGWCVTTNTEIHLSATDAMSGVASKTCYWRGSSTSCGTTTQTGQQGLNEAKITAYDRASNVATSRVQVPVDTVPPSGYANPELELDGIHVAWQAYDQTSGLDGSILVQESIYDESLPSPDVLAAAWNTVCSYSAKSGNQSESGTCVRAYEDLLVPANYCYRLVLEDVASNERTTDARCVLSLHETIVS